jgi:peptidoglycan hydrolase CwlO-like protein
MRQPSAHTHASAARGRLLLLAALLLATLCAIAALGRPAGAETLGEKIDRTQSALDQVRQSQGDVAAAIADQNARIDAMIGEVSALRQRHAEAQRQLAAKQSELDAATAELARQKDRLERIRRRLGRALSVLRERLVAIYMSGNPDMIDVVLGSADLGEIEARAEYLDQIHSYDESIVERVAGLRDQAKRIVTRLAALREQLQAARDAIAAQERELATQQATLDARWAALRSAKAERQATLDSLVSREQALSDNLAALSAQSGGGGESGAPAPSEPAPLAPGDTAQVLPDGTAAAPASAPDAVKAVIAAANQIEDLPYIWGGGHGSFESSGYDCSGAVSYALHGGGFLDSPLDSTGLTTWGEPGAGQWITVYGNSGHAYAVIAGLRWDTSGTGGSGPGWTTEMRSSAGFIARHPSGY